MVTCDACGTELDELNIEVQFRTYGDGKLTPADAVAYHYHIACAIDSGLAAIAHHYRYTYDA